MSDLSVIIPFFNEAGNVTSLCEKVEVTLSRMDLSYEILAIDDGSTDGTTEEIRQAVKKIPALSLIRLRGNFGQTGALQAGIDQSEGDIIVLMDGDGQNDPADIPRLLEKLEETEAGRSFDVVSGWRKDRKDPFLTKKLPSRIANWLIGWLTGVRLHDYGCTLKAYRRQVLAEVRLYGEQHRFIPALASIYGARVTELPVAHHPRTQGRSKYGLGRIHRVFFDLLLVKFLLSYSTRPLQWFGILGSVAFLLGLGISTYLTFCRLVWGQALSERPLLLLGILLIFIGIQFFSMGILGEILIRSYTESTGRKTYSIAEITSGKPENKS